MRRRFISYVIVITIIGCASSEEFIRPGTDFNKYNRIAVLPLVDFPTHPGSGIQVADVLSMSLLKYNIDVIDRSQTIHVLTEQDLGMAGVLDESTTPKVGKMLGVQSILTGSISEWQSTSTDVQIVQGGPPAMLEISAAGITLKLIDCETGQIVWAASARGSMYGLNMQVMAARSAIDDVLEKLIRHLK